MDNNQSLIVWRSSRIDTFKDLIRSMNAITDHILAEHAGKMYDPNGVMFETPILMSLVSRHLTDGSKVFDLSIDKVD